MNTVATEACVDAANTPTEIQTPVDSRPVHPMKQYADLYSLKMWCEIYDTPQHHADYLGALIKTSDATEYETSFSQVFDQTNSQLQHLVDHLEMSTEDTRTILLAQIGALESQLNMVRQKIVDTKLKSAITALDKFRTLMLVAMGQTEESIQSNPILKSMFDPIIRMFYEPMKMLIENPTTTQEEKDRIFSDMLEKVTTSSIGVDTPNPKKSDYVTFVPTLIEIPVEDTEGESKGLSMTTEVPESEGTRRVTHRPKKKDDSMGE